MEAFWNGCSANLGVLLSGIRVWGLQLRSLWLCDVPCFGILGGLPLPFASQPALAFSLCRLAMAHWRRGPECQAMLPFVPR